MGVSVCLRNKLNGSVRFIQIGGRLRIGVEHKQWWIFKWVKVKYEAKEDFLERCIETANIYLKSGEYDSVWLQDEFSVQGDSVVCKFWANGRWLVNSDVLCI